MWHNNERFLFNVLQIEVQIDGRKLRGLKKNFKYIRIFRKEMTGVLNDSPGFTPLKLNKTVLYHRWLGKEGVSKSTLWL